MLGIAAGSAGRSATRSSVGSDGLASSGRGGTAISGGTFRKAPLDLSRLKVVGCGDGRAIAVWGPLSLEGREVWHWKDRRDRRQLAALFTP